MIGCGNDTRHDILPRPGTRRFFHWNFTLGALHTKTNSQNLLPLHNTSPSEAPDPQQDVASATTDYDDNFCMGKHGPGTDAGLPDSVVELLCMAQLSIPRVRKLARFSLLITDPKW